MTNLQAMIEAHPKALAWRWKPKDSVVWIYDPNLMWLRAQSLDDLDAEPVYPEPRADLAPTGNAELRKRIEALADEMWRVHPKDLDAAGYVHISHGGKYENPRAAWYADKIEALIQSAPTGNAALVEALQEVSQALAWQCFGECRGYSDQIPQASVALEKARATPAAATTPTEDVVAMTPAQMLEVYDRSMTGESISRADETNAHRIAMAAAFGAQAYEYGDGGGQSTHAMIRSVLMALIDPTQEGLDYLRKDPDAAREHRAALAKHKGGAA